MKILDRYLLQELISPLGLGLSVFTFVLLMGKIIRLVELIIVNRIPVKMVALSILYLLPSLLIFIIPMSFLFAILMLYGRLSADNEILACRASGISLYRLINPVLIVSLLLVGLTLLISLFIIPRGNSAFEDLILEATWKKATLGLQEKTFNDEIEDLIIYVDEISDTSLKGVMLSDHRRQGETVTIFAKRGELVGHRRLFKLLLRLKDGTIHRHSPINRREYQRLAFSTYDILLPGIRPEDKRDFRKMRISELWEEVQKQKELGHRPYRLLIEWHQRFSIPFACLVFALVGCPLGIQNRKGTKFSGFGLSLIIILIYYALLAFGKTMVYGGWLPAWLSMWLPNFLLIIIGLYLIKHLEEQPR